MLSKVTAPIDAHAFAWAVELHASIGAGVGVQLGTPHNRRDGGAARPWYGMECSLSAMLRSACAVSLCVARSPMCLVCGVHGMHVRCREACHMPSTPRVPSHMSREMACASAEAAASRTRTGPSVMPAPAVAWHHAASHFSRGQRL